MKGSRTKMETEREGERLRETGGGGNTAGKLIGRKTGHEVK